MGRSGIPEVARAEARQTSTRKALQKKTEKLHFSVVKKEAYRLFY
jgi:hypothetical protein